MSKLEESEEELPVPDQFDFPFTPYDIQLEFMQNLYSTIDNKKLGIFESPTGTGKSLSLICGAIRWLKDHNKHKQDQLLQKINHLENEKQLLDDNDDWLSTQAKQIQITQLLHSVKLFQNKMLDYDKRIDDIKSNNREIVNKHNYKKKEKSDIEADVESEQIEDEDILLADENNEEYSGELSDEEAEDRYSPTKIYIASRTHSQLSQLVGEIKKSPFGKDIRVACLASRRNYCINQNVMKLKSMSLINERCLDMQKKTSKTQTTTEEGKVTKKRKTNTNCGCEYFKQQHISELRDWALVEVQDIEDLVQSAKEIKACPYYASRKAAEDAEIILIPYNTLLHKATREANGVELKGNVVIIDEAHNLLEALGQMYGCEVVYNQVYFALEQLKYYKKRYNSVFSASNLLSINQLIFVVTKLLQLFDKKIKEDSTEIFTLGKFVQTAEIDNYNMFKLVKFCRTSKIAQKIRSYSVKYPLHEEMVKKPAKKGIKQFLSSIENKKEEENNKEDVRKPSEPPQIPTNPLLAVINFLETLTYSYEDGRILLSKTMDKVNSKMQFLLLNPSSNFSDIVREARSVIVAGGTMKPISEFKDRLFLNAGANTGRIHEFSCDHIIPPSNILPIAVTQGPKGENLLFNFNNRLSMGDILKQIMQDICKIVKGGIVIFFPSYKYEEWLWQQIKDINFGRPVFREPQNAGSVDSVLEKYADAIKKGSSRSALLLSVVGGKLSEGLNFSDDLGRCVVVVGLPYANVMAADLKEKMTYLDRKEGYGAGHKFYENLCMKSVNQCIGRAVRHKDDYATVLLLDERYKRSSTKEALPGWIKKSLKVANFQEATELITQFFDDRRKEN